MRLSLTGHALPVVIALAALILGQQLLVVPGDSTWGALLQNALHVPWFFCVSLLVFRLFSAKWPSVLILAAAAACLELLQAGTQLGTAAEHQGCAEDNACAAPAEVVKLQQQGRQSESGQSYHCGVSHVSLSHTFLQSLK